MQIRLTYPQCFIPKHTFIFEIKVLAHNLKKGFQTYIVTRTFIPKNIIQHDDLLKKIN